MASIEQLGLILEQTFSADKGVRDNAEAQLKQAQTSPGHALLVLQLVANDTIAPAVRQAAAVHFKNVVKYGWDTSDDDKDRRGIVIPETDRVTIKTNVVELMCAVPPTIQAQCSEAIALMAAVDYPANWTNLLPELVQKMTNPNLAIVNGVLVTANSIFKRFRHVQRSDELYKDILYTLEITNVPLLTLFQSMTQAVEACPNDVPQLQARLTALRTMCRIFYSLNFQDLPEFYEDHMPKYMDIFGKFLQYENALLVDPTEETAPSIVDKLQTAIVDNLFLYADKDEEPFLPFLGDFTKWVWNLLMRVSSPVMPKHDGLATTCIRFLASLVKKAMHKDLFKDKATLQEIIGKIVIPNLMIREVDEERFEDDPEEFIRTDIEGSETDSRRRCSQELLRAMCRQFEAETTEICSTHVGTMLAEYQANPSGKWVAKDAAIHLMLGIAIRAESAAQGVSQVNDQVNIMEFFTTHIFPELQDAHHAKTPMLKATAIKFVCTFRNQFTREQLVSLMPVLIQHLSSPSVVVHTYAAYSIEKILTTKVEMGRPTCKLDRAALQPFLESLFISLFAIIDNTEWNENAYAMKCVMRALNVAKQDIIPVTQAVLDKLTEALARASKNPRNPQYNHYMFESIAVLVMSVCSENASATSNFEALLFPPFQTVLHMEVSEFTPYVFQVLAQLLEYRPKGPVGDAYTALFRPLLTPTLWDQRGNIPALTRLLRAYLTQAAQDLCTGPNSQLEPILGVFQKLIASPANEVSAFDLLTSLTLHVPQQGMAPYVPTVFQILFMRLKQKKTTRNVRLATSYFALYSGKYGGSAFLEQANSIQAGLALNVLCNIWIPRLETDSPARGIETKIQIVGLIKVLADTTPALLQDDNGRQVWARAVTAVVSLLTSSSGGGTSAAEALLEDDATMEMEISSDSTFSSLYFAKRPAEDPFPNVQDPAQAFAHALYQLSAAHPGQLQPILQQLDPKVSASVNTLMQQKGLQLA